jgi:hypothetical protein
MIHDEHEMNDIERMLFLHTPQETLEGLTTNQCAQLTFDFFESESPVVFHPKTAETDWQEMPVLVWVHTLLLYLETEQKSKLTKLGNLNRQLSAHIYHASAIKDFWIEASGTQIIDEQKVDFLIITKQICLQGKWIKKLRGHIQLTKKGKALLTGTKENFFREVLMVHTELTPWSILDAYPPIPIANIGWAYSVFLLLKYRESSNDTIFYADKYEKAFPELCHAIPGTNYTSPIDQFRHCFSIRFFERFAYWWGWIEELTQKYPKKEDVVKLTPLFERCFRLRDD